VSTPYPLALGGGYGSPYSLKMRAVLRYRQIPFTWVLRGSKDDHLPPVPVQLIPVIAFPDEHGAYTEAMIDSSPQIERLETMFTERSLVPTDPVVAFIDYLVEDFGDEWVTKAMYHYRWYYDDAIDKAAKLLPLDRNLQVDDADWERAQRFIADRQIGRRALVGSTEQNRPIIEDSYLRLLALLTAHLRERMFLLGDRPGRGDFGLFGQLRQLVGWDPESARIAVARAPRVVAWVDMLDDLSWWSCTGDDGWVGRDEIPDATTALLHEIGRTYAPFMIANAHALQAGGEEVVCEIDGREYRQGPFAYQGKCLVWLREQYAALGSADRTAVDTLLAGTGSDALVR
jgi:glutathione S-transferase